MFEPENLNTSLFSNLIETTRAELHGAERRLSLAKQALEDFMAEHDNASSRETALLSLAHQHDVLETEIDESLRREAHCREEIEILELCVAVENDTAPNLILGLPQEGEAETEVPGASDQLQR